MLLTFVHEDALGNHSSPPRKHFCSALLRFGFFFPRTKFNHDRISQTLRCSECTRNRRGGATLLIYRLVLPTISYFYSSFFYGSSSNLQ